MSLIDFRLALNVSLRVTAVHQENRLRFRDAFPYDLFKFSPQLPVTFSNWSESVILLFRVVEEIRWNRKGEFRKLLVTLD
jgi:hypothetical protein